MYKRQALNSALDVFGELTATLAAAIVDESKLRISLTGLKAMVPPLLRPLNKNVAMSVILMRVLRKDRKSDGTNESI